MSGEVAPPVGAWIEIGYIMKEGFTSVVAPPVGAWIEIRRPWIMPVSVAGRSPCGSVD